jgi:hypothetical protein
VHVADGGAQVHEQRLEGDHLQRWDTHLRERQLRRMYSGHDPLRPRRLGEDRAM